jgi:hypothetical protein
MGESRRLFGELETMVVIVVVFTKQCICFRGNGTVSIALSLTGSLY